MHHLTQDKVENLVAQHKANAAAIETSSISHGPVFHGMLWSPPPQSASHNEAFTPRLKQNLHNNYCKSSIFILCWLLTSKLHIPTPAPTFNNYDNEECVQGCTVTPGNDNNSFDDNASATASNNDNIDDNDAPTLNANNKCLRSSSKPLTEGQPLEKAIKICNSSSKPKAGDYDPSTQALLKLAILLF